MNRKNFQDTGRMFTGRMPGRYDGGMAVNMQISIILAHPNPASFNHAVANTAFDALKAGGHDVIFHDLYKEKFDPLLPASEFSRDAKLPAVIKKHCREITSSEGIIIVHPNWWGQPPAILKGWVDRVIRPGVAYEFLEGDSGEGVPGGLLKARQVVVYNTSNTMSKREKEIFGDPLETLWRNCIFGLCGVKKFHRRMFTVVVTSSEDRRKKWLDLVRQDADRLFKKSRA